MYVKVEYLTSKVILRLYAPGTAWSLWNSKVNGRKGFGKEGIEAAPAGERL
jgi:hypothetical protein